MRPGFHRIVIFVLTICDEIVPGGSLLDANGRPVRLLGVNTASLEWMAAAPALPAAVVHACDVWKANVIRLPLSQDTWFGFHPEQKGKDEW